jgi:Asp-tRNA(Asn)/Glu-tRNA(Gln) amidotransferase C subunit
MLKTTIANIENKIKRNASIQDKDKAELLRLLSSLQDEVSELSKIDNEQAESITGFAQTSAHEATRKDKNEDLLDLSLKGLTSSVGELESSHPKLVEIVNRISQMLSNMGI